MQASRRRRGRGRHRHGTRPGHTDLNAVSGVNCITAGASAQDDNGHGTHVAGTLAGRNTGSGVVGVAPGTKLYAVKVLDRRAAGSLSSILCGVDWGHQERGRPGHPVANMSVGATGGDDGACGAVDRNALHAAICRSVAAGVLYVASAGNSGVDFAQQAPASFGEVLTVTGTTDTDGVPGAKGPRLLREDRHGRPAPQLVQLRGERRAGRAPHRRPRHVHPVGQERRRHRGDERHEHGRPPRRGVAALCLGSGGAPGPARAWLRPR
jgi:hypothetical protein